MSAFTATPTLIRLALRRDRIRLPAWLVGLGALVGLTGASLGELYGTAADRAANAATRASSVVGRAFTGPAPGPSLGALTMAETLVFACVGAALLNILTVVRHTRQNEELGRTELTGSAAVGRHATLTAALLVAGIANVGLTVVCAGWLVATGLPVAGSIAAGCALGATGAVFAAITAVCAQLAEGARGATGLGTAVLGVAFLLRATGDALGETTADGFAVTAAWPSWLSPIGWAQQLQPYGSTRWWPLALFAGLAVVGVAVAAWLSGHRDVGTGMLPVRRGRERASAGLRRPFGVAWRLQRGPLLGWIGAVAVFGGVFGGIGDQIDDLFASDDSAELMRQLGGGGALVDAYFTALMGLLGVVVAGYTVQTLLRSRGDETSGTAEAVLATAVSRPRWLTAQLLCAVLGTVLVLAALGGSTATAYWLVSGDGPAAVDLLKVTAAQLPPILVLAGCVVAAFGFLPRLAVALSWLAFAACLVIGQFGTLLRLPTALIDVSPFTHVPDLPADPLAVLPLSVMVAVAGGLVVAGVVAFRHRSLALG
jgi:polyether ionophore transport system permease protein